MDDDGSARSFEEFREWWNKQLTQQVLEHHGTDRDPHEEYLTNHWSKADADGSGILDRDEPQASARLGRLLQEEELDVAFAIMDEDGSGGIEYDEFRNWFEWLQAEDLTIGRLFDQVDKDDSACSTARRWAGYWISCVLRQGAHRAGRRDGGDGRGQLRRGGQGGVLGVVDARSLEGTRPPSRSTRAC